MFTAVFCVFLVFVLEEECLFLPKRKTASSDDDDQNNGFDGIAYLDFEQGGEMDMADLNG